MLMTTLGRTKEQGVTMLVIPIYDIIAVRKLILGAYLAEISFLHLMYAY